jgi:hypothetical protein
MPAIQQRTDRATLEGLLTCGKLTRGEQTAFQQMYDDLMGGKIIGLTKNQRLWADTVYEKNKVGDMRVESRKKARARLNAEKTTFLDRMPKPLKPPGRT